MKLKSLLYAAVIGVMSLSSCSDFLDKIPDNRVDPQTPEQLLLMLVDGYSYANYAKYCEYSSDNIVDNTSPDRNGMRYNLQGMGKLEDEMFAWEDAKSDDGQDSPSMIWEGAYHAIAVANHVLEKIDLWKKQGRQFEGNDKAMLQAAYGEALMVRAYNHFMLVNIFAQHYRSDELSANDPGIPYVTKPEKQVVVQYNRQSVAEVYKLIEQDLEEGLPYVSDLFYERPKYHFNKRASYAFATRFYLFKRDYEKVEKYASLILGSTPEQMMRTYWGKNYVSLDASVQAYIDSQSPSNLMLMTTYSMYWRAMIMGNRYTVNREPAFGTIFGTGPTWNTFNFHPCYLGKLYVCGGQEYGLWFPKVYELFEYSDKVAGIGFVHIVRTEFTTEEVILSRAEARIFMGDLEGAVADMRVWDNSRQKLPASFKFSTLTSDIIKSFYDKAAWGDKYRENDPRPEVFKTLNIDEITPSDKYSVTPEIEPYLYCVLHFRRIENLFDGGRWFDVKRFGIEYEHKIGRDRVEFLSKLDPRRALQIPSEVISAGIEPNNRMNVVSRFTNPSGYMKYTGSIK